MGIHEYGSVLQGGAPEDGEECRDGDKLSSETVLISLMAQ